MALIATDFGPIAPEIAPVADRTLLKSVFGVIPMPVGRTVTTGVPAGAVVTGVAGDAAPAAAVIGAVTVAAA